MSDNVPLVPTQATHHDITDLVDRLDPGRHDETVEYDFSNGRRFWRRGGESDVYTG